MKATWIPVHDVADLRPGMTIKIVALDRTYIALLLGYDNEARTCGAHVSAAWRVAPRLTRERFGDRPCVACLADGVARGRVFRRDIGIANETAASQMRKLVSPTRNEFDVEMEMYAELTEGRR